MTAKQLHSPFIGWTK